MAVLVWCKQIATLSLHVCIPLALQPSNSYKCVYALVQLVNETHNRPTLLNKNETDIQNWKINLALVVTEDWREDSGAGLALCAWVNTFLLVPLLRPHEVLIPSPLLYKCFTTHSQYMWQCTAIKFHHAKVKVCSAFFTNAVTPNVL